MLRVDFKMVIGSFTAIETIDGQEYTNRYDICKANCLGAIILKEQNGNDANNTLAYFLADKQHLKISSLLTISTARYSVVSKNR